MKGTASSSSNQSATASSSTEGAKGRNDSRRLILALRMLFMSARRGSQTIERLPSARGPHSMRPWNQPTTLPSATAAAARRHSSASAAAFVVLTRQELFRIQEPRECRRQAGPIHKKKPVWVLRVADLVRRRCVVRPAVARAGRRIKRCAMASQALGRSSLCRRGGADRDRWACPRQPAWLGGVLFEPVRDPRPAFTASFSSRLLRCLGTGTIVAPIICPQRAR